jgi:hypothetical protein
VIVLLITSTQVTDLVIVLLITCSVHKLQILVSVLLITCSLHKLQILVIVLLITSTQVIDTGDCVVNYQYTSYRYW